MFDVSDPTKPVEVNQKLIDSSESWSNEFVYNYKAILADPEKNLIGFTAVSYTHLDVYKRQVLCFQYL